MNGIHSDAGFYRRHGVRIIGANVPTANYVKIPYLMEELVKSIYEKTENIVYHVAVIHSNFEKIHPFGDGNGRVGRLIMSAMLLKENIPPCIIIQKEKHKYYSCLNKAQLNDDFTFLEEFILDGILDGYKVLTRE